MSHTVNTRNQFRGRITQIRRGEVVSEIELTTAAGMIASVITTSSLVQLGLQIGDEATAMFKATDVLIGAPSSRHSLGRAAQALGAVLETEDHP
jgi:molybdopterin-binding protein